MFRLNKTISITNNFNVSTRLINKKNKFHILCLSTFAKLNLFIESHLAGVCFVFLQYFINYNKK